MRRTVLARGEARLILQTGDAGTELLDGAGQALAQHGTDRHEETMERLGLEGWHAAEDAEVRPAEAAGTPPPPPVEQPDGGEPDLGLTS